MSTYSRMAAKYIKIPVWPLPCDWKWAGTDVKPLPTPGCPNPTVQCTRCTQWLSPLPKDTTGGYRRHIKGLKCRKGTEVVNMNREGYHLMSLSGNGFWAECLRPVMRVGKYYKYFPAPVVSFIRWKLDNEGTSCSNVPKGFTKELEQFLALTDEQQVGMLAGAILEHEFKMESAASASNFR